jgi:hypothetical protein
MTTPISSGARDRFRSMPPLDAVVRAWTDAGSNAAWHRAQQEEVRRRMPLLAESLDRLAALDRLVAEVTTQRRGV